MGKEMCSLCQKVKTPQPHQGLMHIRLYQKPWETIGIDLMGPFPETRVTKYKYVMTVVDFFTDYLVVVPIQNKSAQTVATALFTHVLGVHGCPLKLMSDRGTEFLNQVINHLCKTLSVKKIYTSAYRLQAKVASTLRRTVSNYRTFTVLPRSNSTENRGQPRFARVLDAVDTRAARGEPRLACGPITAVRPRASLMSTACCPLLLRLISIYGGIR